MGVTEGSSYLLVQFQQPIRGTPIAILSRVMKCGWRKNTADTHWRCEACGRVFLPEERKDLHEDMAQNDGVSPDADVLENSIPETTENVSHLRRLD